jgi:hypothetical protein
MLGKEFLLAGKAVFTVSNPSGVRYTFRIKKSEFNGKSIWFAGLLAGPNNEADFVYMGVVSENGSVFPTAKSKLQADSLPCKVLKWSLGLVWSGSEVPEGYKIQHAGKCGRCGRTLTVPESLESGLGPECSEKVFGN